MLKEFMLVNQRGTPVTKNTHPKITSFKVTRDEGHMYITAPDVGDLMIALNRAPGKPVEVRVKSQKSFIACAQSSYADEYFSRYLNEKVRLVRRPSQSPTTAGGGQRLHRGSSKVGDPLYVQ